MSGGADSALIKLNKDLWMMVVDACQPGNGVDKTHGL
jgi:predicted GTPase